MLKLQEILLLVEEDGPQQPCAGTSRGSLTDSIQVQRYALLLQEVLSDHERYLIWRLALFG